MGTAESVGAANLPRLQAQGLATRSALPDTDATSDRIVNRLGLIFLALIILEAAMVAYLIWMPM